MANVHRASSAVIHDKEMAEDADSLLFVLPEVLHLATNCCTDTHSVAKLCTFTISASGSAPQNATFSAPTE